MLYLRHCHIGTEKPKSIHTLYMCLSQHPILGVKSRGHDYKSWADVFSTFFFTCHHDSLKRQEHYYIDGQRNSKEPMNSKHGHTVAKKNRKWDKKSSSKHQGWGRKTGGFVSRLCLH